MICVLCVFELQSHQSYWWTRAGSAITVYNGNALCFRHLNLVRDLPEEHGIEHK